MKKPILLILLILSGMALTFNSCYWVSEEDFYPMVECDTMDVSFSLDVLPILTNNCLGCHSNQNAPSFAFGFALEDHADVAASGSLIVGAITHTEGFSPMPKNQSMLDTCSIKTISAWVNQGSQDN